jgi:hypothetical protein
MPYCVPPTTNGGVNAAHVVGAGQPVFAGGAQFRLHIDGPDEGTAQV